MALQPKRQINTAYGQNTNIISWLKKNNRKNCKSQEQYTIESITDSYLFTNHYSVYSIDFC